MPPRAPFFFKSAGLHNRLRSSILRKLSPTPRTTPTQHGRKFALAGGLLMTLGATASVARAPDDNDQQESITRLPISSLLRTYIVYAMCSIPPLVDNAPQILKMCTSIPGVRWITESIVRVTFFNQFVGGDTVDDTLPLLHNLRSSKTGALFAYAAEVDESESAVSKKNSTDSPQKRVVEELLRSIDAAADFEDTLGTSGIRRRTWVAVKITALIPDANALVNFSKYLLHSRPQPPVPIAFPGCPTNSDLDIIHGSTDHASFNVEDRAAILELHRELVRISCHAKERGVCLIFDAEYSWYQPALDSLVLSLMRQFNQLPNKQSKEQFIQPLIYNTLQGYLQRTQEYLDQSLVDAKKHNYAFGIKLVRGAYHTYETAAHADPSHSISTDSHPPVWATKQETDACYDACAKLLVHEIKKDIHRSTPSIAVLFGTHNKNSCRLILEEVAKEGMAVLVNGPKGDIFQVDDGVAERITFGQLYGMADALTDYLVASTRSCTPMVLKWIPYGALSEAMPYLSRRAMENKSILGNGGAALEMRRVRDEILRRLLFWRTNDILR